MQMAENVSRSLYQLDIMNLNIIKLALSKKREDTTEYSIDKEDRRNSTGISDWNRAGHESEIG